MRKNEIIGLLIIAVTWVVLLASRFFTIPVVSGFSFGRGLAVGVVLSCIGIVTMIIKKEEKEEKEEVEEHGDEET